MLFMKKLLFVIALCLSALSGLQAQTVHRYDAKLDGRIPVTIALQQTNGSVVAGYIYYPRAKTPAPIMVIGSVMQYPDNEASYFLSEYQSDGSITGTISIQLEKGKLHGTWTNPKTQKTMALAGVSVSRQTPEWFTESLLVPEDASNIGREYSYEQWSPKYNENMGGTISFRAAGKNKVHFECMNAFNNIAEGSSEEGRPAVLDGNVFEYYEVNECHYAFRATFFRRFVVLESISGGESTRCFGMNASFDGVYVKVKQ